MLLNDYLNVGKSFVDDKEIKTINAILDKIIYDKITKKLIALQKSQIIYNYLRKLNFNKEESFNFTNDGAFLKAKKNKDIIVTNDSIIEGVDFFKNDSLLNQLPKKLLLIIYQTMSSMGGIPLLLYFKFIFTSLKLQSSLVKKIY